VGEHVRQIAGGRRKVEGNVYEMWPIGGNHSRRLSGSLCGTDPWRSAEAAHQHAPLLQGAGLCCGVIGGLIAKVTDVCRENDHG
jgi:hypothetical protein